MTMRCVTENTLSLIFVDYRKFNRILIVLEAAVVRFDDALSGIGLHCGKALRRIWLSFETRPRLLALSV